MRVAYLVVLIVALGPLTMGCRSKGAPPSAPLSDSSAVAATAQATSASASAVDRLFCFSWIHGTESSVDCYRTMDACEGERTRTLAGARPVTPACEPRSGGACTTLLPGPTTKPTDGQSNERCFGDVANCERYRAFVAKNKLASAACVPP